MNSKDIKRSLQNSATQLPKPDFEKISSAVVEPMSDHDYITIQSKKTSARPRMGLAVAATCIALLLTFGILGNWYLNNQVMDAIVDIDMNPSYEIVLNRKQQVMEVIPLNSEAIKISQGQNLKGMDIEDAVYMLFIDINEKFTIRSQHPAILISLDVKSPSKLDYLQRTVTDTIDLFMAGADLSADIFSQSLTAEDELRTTAAQYGISAGKMHLVRQLLSLGVKQSERELAEYPLEELMELAVTYSLIAPTGTSYASAAARNATASPSPTAKPSPSSKPTARPTTPPAPETSAPAAAQPVAPAPQPDVPVAPPQDSPNDTVYEQPDSPYEEPDSYYEADTPYETDYDDYDDYYDDD